ncbi:hypothetical protein EZ449_14345 [Pedobacter frigidisoli]|uniref:PEP-CTERM protein-sorting domain-containing protein n=1 Tax=Pedobacter frigidisoli TaxID=2530455 RepID=A0A4R0NZ22_9SPHI|nr:hypothetical protein [Pedobacter frigidisoli]TCD07709.1 hypothetical protein EZ449_14345 [Pedobacter frigidisoli]
MMKRLQILIVMFCLMLLVMVSNNVMAQACDPDLDPFCTIDPDDYPLDDNIYYLMGILGLAAFFKIRSSHNKSSQAG